MLGFVFGIRVKILKSIYKNKYCVFGFLEFNWLVDSMFMCVWLKINLCEVGMQFQQIYFFRSGKVVWVVSGLMYRFIYILIYNYKNKYDNILIFVKGWWILCSII